MEIHDRIKELRTYLKLSRNAFGDRLGVSGDAIANIEYNRLARPDQKLSLIKLMCKEFNVREEWLMNGEGPMWVEPEVFSLDQFIKDRGAGDIEKRILMEWFSLDPGIRAEVLESFKKAFSDDIKTPDSQLTYQQLQDEVPKTPEELESLYPPVPVDEIDGKKDAG